MKKIVLALALIAIALPLFGEDEFELLQTNGSLNGRGWNTMSPVVKMGYLLGFNEGQITADCGNVMPKADVSALTKGEVAEELDTFFAEPANRPIAVHLALQYVHAKARGTSAEQLANVLEMMRKHASKKP